LLASTDSAADALAIAELAGRMENGPLYKDALQRAIFLDRHCQPALLQLASLSLELGEQPSAALLLGEAARVAPLPPEIDKLRSALLADHSALPEIAAYRAIIDRSVQSPAATVRRVLLVTNLFPPEELGGYGRMMWEFAHGLRSRGHEVRVLCGEAPYLRKTPTAEEAALESQVTRELTLLGEWREGVARPVGRPDQLMRLAAQNGRRVVSAALSFGADLVLLGNLDFLGTDLLHAALAAGFPVLHTLANAAPGFAPSAQPTVPHYWVAPCSDWNGAIFRRTGYHPAQMETLYPGARLENFYRHIFPDTRRLRIAYASLVMPYKGAHVLVEALARLHQSGIPFTAEIAGDTTDQTFLEKLKTFAASTGMADRIKFPGFLGRDGLSALFARSNVLVFPSQFDEPFGISQVEALAAGLVLVSSGTGGAAEIISDGLDGLRFPAPDAEALAQRLALLARNPALFQELQRNGRRRALDFSVDAAVAGIERRMDVLCGQPALQISA
jgi:glycosyltransferase involved in cell wall biosynthesis